MIAIRESCKWLVLCVFFLCPISSAAQDVENSFSKGVAAYNNGQYGEAIATFESLLQGGYSANLFYNLASSYAQNGQIGLAILYFERAARLAPGDPDIQGNLELVRKEKSLFQEEQGFKEGFIRLFPLDHWLWIFIGGTVVLAASSLLSVSKSNQTKSRLFVIVCSLSVMAMALLGFSGQYKYYDDAVVIVDNAKLRVSPFSSAAVSGSMREGRMISPGKIYKDYTLVSDASGRSGWLANGDFKRIAPADRH